MPVKKFVKQSIGSRIHHTIRDVLVPHERNDFQPHLIRSGAIVAILVVVGALAILPSLGKESAILGESTDVTMERLLEVTNLQRADRNLAPLQLNQRLNMAATDKARDMLKRQYWSHEAPDGTTPWQWIKDSGYSYSYAGENLAKGFRSSSGVMTAWMNSPEHRKNVLSKNYADVGFAVIPGTLDGETTNVIVALYGAPSTVATNEISVLAAGNTETSIVTKLGIGLQSMSPALLGTVFLLTIMMAVSLAAHAYRNKLPAPLQRDWRRHHGLYKAFGMASVVILLAVLYGGGQI